MHRWEGEGPVVRSDTHCMTDIALRQSQNTCTIQHFQVHASRQGSPLGEETIQGKFDKARVS